MSTESDDTPIVPDGIVQGGGLADDREPEEEHDDIDPIAALLGGGSGGSGGLDLGALMEQATAMQAQLHEAQAQAAQTVVEGVAGGGVVKVAVTGAMEFQSVTIAPEAVDPDDVEMLQDLVLAALRDASERVQDLQRGSLDLGGFGGLLG